MIYIHKYIANDSHAHKYIAKDSHTHTHTHTHTNTLQIIYYKNAKPVGLGRFRYDAKQSDSEASSLGRFKYSFIAIATAFNLIWVVAPVRVLSMWGQIESSDI